MYTPQTTWGYPYQIGSPNLHESHDPARTLMGGAVAPRGDANVPGYHNQLNLTREECYAYTMPQLKL